MLLISIIRIRFILLNGVEIWKIGTVNQLTDPTALDDGDAIAIPDEELDPFAEQTYALREAKEPLPSNLSGTASVTGRKLWENLPSGYPREICRTSVSAWSSMWR